MQFLVLNSAALLVAALYAGWKLAERIEQRRQRTLRERVAYLLWTVAQRA